MLTPEERNVIMEVESEEFMGVLMAKGCEIHMYGRYGKVERYVTVYPEIFRKVERLQEVERPSTLCNMLHCRPGPEDYLDFEEE